MSDCMRKLVIFMNRLLKKMISNLQIDTVATGLDHYADDVLPN